MNVIISQYRRFLTKGNTDADFVEKLLGYLCTVYAGYTFFYLTYDKLKSSNPLPGNAQKIPISIPVVAMAVKKSWYKLKLKKLVKQLNVDIIVHVDDYIPILKAKEWLLLRDLSYDNLEQLRSITGIITPSLIIKQTLIKDNIQPADIKILRYLPNNTFKPVGWDEREYLKQRFANGREYLLLEANNTSLAHLLNVLKGFSTIKKWLKTSTKLIIINNPELKKTVELLNSYKYKNDVIMIHNSENFAYTDLLSAAFAFIYIPQSSKNELPLLQAIQCGVPTITYKNDFFFETCNEGVIYINPDNEDDIGEKLMKICKDEKTRSLLAQKGTSQLEVLKANNDSFIFE